MRWLSVVHVCNCRYGCMYVLADFCPVCVNHMAIPSAYEVKCSDAGGCGMSDVYMVKSVGECTLPCGAPVLNWRCVEVCALNVVYALLPFM